MDVLASLYPDMWIALERVRAHLGIEHHDMADLMDLSVERYECLRSTREVPPFLAVTQFVRRTGVDFGGLVTGELDLSRI